MDFCDEIIEFGPDVEVINIRDYPYLYHLDNSMKDEVDIFNMTALSTLVFLSQRESNNEGNDTATPAIESSSANDDATKSLSLAYERLHTFPRTILEQFSATVHTLDISYNEFDNLDFLKDFHNLSTLICDHNNITSKTIIPETPHLKIIWLNYCKITELYPWARYLRNSCPKLKYISLMGNTAAPSYLNGGSFYEYLQYRLFIISLFPSLEYLDDRSVSAEQRREAQRLYRRPLLERLTLAAPTVRLRAVSDKLSNIFNTGSVYNTASSNSNNKNMII